MKNILKHIALIILFLFLAGTETSAQTIQNNILASAQNYPNPFNPTTQIQFELTQNSDVTVKVFNILGREIKTLVENKSLSAGQHSTVWDGKDRNGNLVPSGMYLYQVQAGNSVLTKKMALLK